MAESLLNLNTLTQREVVRIDGVPYELRNAEELSLVENHRLQTHGKRIHALMKKSDALSEDEEADLTKLSRGLIDMIVVELPSEVMDKLSDFQRTQIMEVFMDHAGVDLGGPARDKSKSKSKSSKKKTRASKSRTSSASTAATQNDGYTSPAPS